MKTKNDKKSEDYKVVLDGDESFINIKEKSNK